ncbi:hypothetical protein A1OQ_11665 [Enterovibrio norvegicus FF-162]|uniref:DUF4123 domain-containing protein n=1 Tax=Enterovibrio norvegicus TaxID=188144 RepID=UPI00030E916E|nr:DUF4123 domain-containing protein [Enterovibrio norvegicus]OEE89361.1 hypothetical protein A1OQ_11665 [Enterovibrio norvegicus FF-162]
MKVIVHRYAVIDAAAESEFLSAQWEGPPEMLCLFPEPIDKNFAAAAPYVVALTDELDAWLTMRKTPWGFYCTSLSPIAEVRNHLRESLQAVTPDSPTPVLFRYFDPRLIWAYLDTLNGRECYDFLGPLLSVATRVSEDRREDDFELIRIPFKNTQYYRRGPLVLSEEQYSAIQKASRACLIHAVVSRINDVRQEQETVQASTSLELPAVHTLRVKKDIQIGDEEESVEQTGTIEFAKALVIKLASVGVTDKRSLCGIAELCAIHQLLTISSFPHAWWQALSDTTAPGTFRAEMLLIKELGHVPALEKK